MLYVTTVTAQQNDIFSSYGVDDGLPQSSIWSMVQDTRGFLWLGTSDGICRFDGYNFTVYRSDTNNAKILTRGIYARLYHDKSDNLWTMSQNGVCLYDKIKDRFVEVSNYQIRFLSNYNYIFGEDDHFVWAGLSGNGIIKIDKQTHNADVIKSTPGYDITKIRSWLSGFVSRGKIWTAVNDSGCFVYDINAGSFEKINVPHPYRITDLNDSEVLASSRRDLVLISKKDNSYKTISFANGGKIDETITDILVLSPSEILLASANGIFFVDSKSWSITRHVESFARGQQNSYAYVQCLFKDRSGNIWIGTNGDGIKKLVCTHKNFKFYSSNNVKGNLVKAIYADRKNLYVGYYGIGLDLFDRKSGLVKSVSLLDLSFPSNNILALSTTDSEHLLIQSDRNDLMCYNVQLDRDTKDISLALQKLFPGKNLKDSYPFFLKTANDLYTNVSEDCLVSLNATSVNAMSPRLVRRFKDEILTCGFVAGDGTLWVGSLNGVFYVTDSGYQKLALPEFISIKSINQDGNGNIWIGTIKGIYVLDSSKRIIQHYSESNGLANQFIYGILRDDDGNVWFSHNKGISRYDLHSRSFRHYTREDGLQSNEFNTGAFFKAADGELFFGGINGTNSFFPADIQDNPNAPNVCITAIKLFDEPLKTDTSYWNVHTLTLPFKQNSLSFEFAALEFTNPRRNQYAYMMEGVDNAWIKAGDKRFARYAGLPPGQYVFKVKASNNDGVWQETPATVLITIVPPFWQQLWFRLITVFFALTCVAGTILRIQKQRHRRQIRALELQQKIQMERERISRDLHDNVGTQLSLISNNIEWVTHPLKVISENEKADKLQFVNNTARDIIATLRETIWALNKEHITLEEFTDKLKAFTRKQLTIYPEIELKFTEGATEQIMLGPSEALNLFRICQEAIANALKYSDARLITIGISNDSNRYQVRIADNGHGFDINAVDPSVQNGLENMRFRARDIACTLEIDTMPGKGTVVTIAKI